jgi:hypothetical protein
VSERAGLAIKKPESHGKDSTSVKSRAELSPSMNINSPVEQILHLQRSIGNQAVTRLIQSGVLQAKLSIGQPGDIYEQEADRAAEQVMYMSEPAYSECMQEEMIQAKGSTLQNREIVPSIGLAANDLVQRTNGGGAAPCTPRPVATLNAFNNTGQTSPNNCCLMCPTTLGVSPDDQPYNAMEMEIKIDNHCSDSLYDIKRACEIAIYEQVQIGGDWQWRILVYSSLSRDDLGNRDECLTLQNGSFIYVMDWPGWHCDSSLPHPDGMTYKGFVNGIETDPDAEQVVLKANFYEYVKFKNDSHNIDWTIISDSYFPWHTTTWLEKQGGQWQLNVDNSEIERGEQTISTTPE